MRKLADILRLKSNRLAETKLPDGDRTVDFSMFERADRNYIHDQLESYWGGYASDERRKWGITQNGLCILISWSAEVSGI